MKQNHMSLVACPVSGKTELANSTKLDNMYRCCKCGELHRGVPRAGKAD